MQKFFSCKWNKENCIELNNLPLTMREQRQNCYKQIKNQKHSLSSINRFKHFKCNQKSSKGSNSILTPLSLVTEAQCNSINPFCLKFEGQQNKEKQSGFQSIKSSNSMPINKKQLNSSTSDDKKFYKQKNKKPEFLKKISAQENNQDLLLDNEITAVVQQTSLMKPNSKLRESISKLRGKIQSISRTQSTISQNNQQQCQKQLTFSNLINRDSTIQAQESQKMLQIQQSIKQQLISENCLQNRQKIQSQQSIEPLISLSYVSQLIQEVVLVTLYFNQKDKELIESNSSQNYIPIHQLQFTLGDLIDYTSHNCRLQVHNKTSSFLNKFIPKSLALTTITQAKQQRSSIVPRKSISLFSRMMKQSQNEESFNPNRVEKSIQQRKYRQELQVLSYFLSCLQKIEQLIQEQQKFSEVFQQIISRKTSIFFQSQYKAQSDIFCTSGQQGERHQNILHADDEEWNNKYITLSQKTSRIDSRKFKGLECKINLNLLLQKRSQLAEGLSLLIYIIKQIVFQILASFQACTVQLRNQFLNHSGQISHLLSNVLSIQNLGIQIVELQNANEFSTKQQKPLFRYLLDQLRQENKVICCNASKQESTNKTQRLGNQNFVFSSVFQFLNTHNQRIVFLISVLKVVQDSLKLKFRPQKINDDQMNKATVRFQQRINLKQNINQRPISKKITSKLITNELKTIRQTSQPPLAVTNNKPTAVKIAIKSQLKQSFIQKATTKSNQSERMLQGGSKQCFSQKENQEPNSAISFVHKQSSKNRLTKIYQKKLNHLLNYNNFQIQQFNTNSKKSVSSRALNFQSQRILKNTNRKEASTVCNQVKSSKDPKIHQQHLYLLNLQNKVRIQEEQLRQKSQVIKRLLLLQQIEEIQRDQQKKRQKIINSTRIESVRNEYRNKLKGKENQLRQCQNLNAIKDHYFEVVSNERQLQARILSENSHLHALQRHLASTKQNQNQKTIYRSLSNLRKGCYYSLNDSKGHKQNKAGLNSINFLTEL